MKRLVIALAMLVIAAIAVAPVALAKPKSHHHVSRAQKLAHWEHHFHFNLTKANALADSDGDAVSNANEFVDNTNPKNADTNHDGVSDGSEDHNHNGIHDNMDAAATVSSFTAATATSPAILVIKLTDGTLETGQITDATQLTCETAPVVTPPATTTRDHGGDGSDDGNGGPITVSTTPVTPGSTGDPGGQGHDHGQGGDDQGDDDQGDDDQGEGDNHGTPCTTAALTVGTVVHSADLKVTSAGAVFAEIELVK